MDNTSSSQLSPNTGNPLNPKPIPPLASEPATTSTIESIVSTPLEPVVTESVSEEKLPTVIESIVNEHKVQINDHESDLHPEKTPSCCSMLNKLILALAVVCFALFLCSIGYIVMNLEGLNGKYNGYKIEKVRPGFACSDDFFSERLIDDSFFNLSHPNNEGFLVVVSRRGAAIRDIFIPYKDVNGQRKSRSIVVKGGNENNFGAVRFGFDDPKNPMNMTNQLPSNYPYRTLYQDDWSMQADPHKPYRVSFTKDRVQVIYEFSAKYANELMMTTMVATPSNQQRVADPTNNIYFNLRGHGTLNTHFLNLSSSTPMDILSAQKLEQDRLIQSQRVDKLINVNNYFYTLDRAGIGKNHVATLFESETKTTMNVFSNHAGVVIDPFGVGYGNETFNTAMMVPELRGVRISPRQSPLYQPTPLYGPTLIVFPSEAIHTTWWQFNTEL